MAIALLPSCLTIVAQVRVNPITVSNLFFEQVIHDHYPHTPHIGTKKPVLHNTGKSKSRFQNSRIFKVIQLLN